MLNGIDPVIIFNFETTIPGILETLTKIPTAGASSLKIPLPFIPIYLSERLTGICIDSESKSLEIQTDIETVKNDKGVETGELVYYQKGLSSTIKIEMVAARDSIGVSLFAALADLIFPKVTAQEYSVTYLHGAITVFSGLLHAFSITQNANNDLYNITLELQKPSGKGGVASLTKSVGAPTVPALPGTQLGPS